MPTILQLRRGTTSQSDAFTGAIGEVTVDTDNNQLRLHDGSTAGGHTIGATDTSSLVSKSLIANQVMKANLHVDSEGASSGVQIANGSIQMFTATGSPSQIDFYCEVSNAHYTRLQSAAHADYSGNVTLTLPVTTGTLALDADVKDRMQVANTTTLINSRMQTANTIAMVNARLGAAATVALTGDVTASATAFSSNAASIATTIAANSVDGSKLADNIVISENLTVSGNLVVSGTQTTVNSNDVNIGDAIITLNSDLGGGVAASEDAGITINRGSDTDVSFIYDESEDQWSLGSEQLVSGDLIPASDSAEDLGTNAVRWRSAFVDAATITNDLAVGGDITVTGNINATVQGQANTAAALSTARAIALAGDVTGTANFDGSSDISITATIATNSVALGTDTTGNYVGTVTGGTGITSSGATSGEGIAHTLELDVDSLTAETSFQSTDIIAVYDVTAGAMVKGTIANVALQGPAGADGATGADGAAGADGADGGFTTDSDAQVNSLGVGTAGSTTTGEIRATNNITAYYSDARLKDFDGHIDNAMDKVMALNGYYFYENAKAKELGYDNDARQVGVSAQEVDAVMPEVTSPAPINGNFEGADYMTVSYEKLVPLLIEAIKELKAEIEELKS